MLFYRNNREDRAAGYQAVVEGNANPLQWLRFGILTAKSGDSPTTLRFEGEETALVILTGTVAVSAGDQHWDRLGGRRSVFEAAGATVYVPADMPFAVSAVSETAEMAVCRARAQQGGEPFVVNPQEVRVAARGQDHWHRQVRDILTTNADGRVQRLVVGETINARGEWSGYPPHRHQQQREREEAAFEELYYYRVNPSQGFGIQVHYGSRQNPDQAYIARDGDVFAIPDGYHPVVAAGGYALYYLWFMAGPGGRALVPYEDPAHRWVNSPA